MACSTLAIFSIQESSRECWLTADKNLRINLVLSVLPAPLSPLEDKKKKENKSTVSQITLQKDEHLM